MAIEQTGQLNFGADVDGVNHKRFVMRAATIGDAIAAIEKVGDAPSNLKLRIYKAAEQMLSLGTLDKSAITGELLMQLDEEDIEPIFNAQDAIEKKRKGLKSSSSPI